MVKGRRSGFGVFKMAICDSTPKNLIIQNSLDGVRGIELSV